MIADADQSLANFLGSVLDKGTSVTFETPSEEWEKSVKRPALVCFLHRVVEDIDRRAGDWRDERGPDGRVGARQPPVRHYQLHYQVSAWAKSVEDEHRLLGRVMEACLAGEVIAPRHLAGALEGEAQPVLIRLGVPMADPGPQSHDVWSSLGMPMRASLDLTLVAPLRPTLDTDIAPPAEELTLDMEWIASRSRARAAAATPLVDRRWTAFRIREKASDDPGLHGVGDGV
ncbi:MAG TPA: DUF4255 domain-containing protein [Ilumatobacteraceae bacterium]|nr:DUF4255 domain-containing protein [Ilumatobacteraceae bacterium]